jgi:hypothetical protein
MRCTFCAGYLAHSFITNAGIDVYRCGGENSFNDKGRYFILVASGPVEVLPTKAGRSWTYEIIDTERRRLAAQAKQIEEELNARQKLYRSNLRDTEERLEEEDEVSN